MPAPRLTEQLGRFLDEGRLEDTLQRDVQLWRFERPEFVSFTTLGLSELDIAALKPQELVCSVEHGQDGAAAHLVRSMLEMILETDRGLIAPQLVPAPEPILADTRITGLLASSHPYLDEAFEALRDPAGRVQVQIITLLPLTRAEVDHGQRAGEDALEALLEDTDPPVLDVTRT